MAVLALLEMAVAGSALHLLMPASGVALLALRYHPA